MAYPNEADALFAAMTVAPNAARRSLISNTIAALKSADLWDDFDLFKVQAAHHSQAARLNWKSPGTYTDTVIGAPTFTVDRGYTGNGTDAALDTGFVPSTHAVQMTTNAAHWSAWTLTSRTVAASTILFGARQDSPGPITELGPFFVASTFARINDRANGVPAPANIQGFWVSDRPDATGSDVYLNNTLHGSPATDTAVGLPNLSIYLLGTHTPTGLTKPCTDQISVLTMGAALGSTKRTALYEILQTYLSAVGAV